jgi:aspartyl-tRNA(Asn)/glutamyl-tRNA(Gln) amidotransferase subunit A
MTGNVGLKTTKGRWSTDLITILSTSFDTPGILAKSVSDISFGFNAIDPLTKASVSSAIETRDVSGIKLGITRDYFWDRCADDVGETVENAIAELKNAGARTSNIKLPEAGTSVQVWGEGAIVASEGYSFLQTRLPDWIDSLDPNVLSRMEVAKEAKTLDYFSALFKISKLSQSVHAKLETVDALVVPTVPITPPKIEDLVDGEAYKKNNLLALSNTMPGNVLGVCAITIPAGLDKSGMPVGLQLIALPNREEELISLALGIEKILGTPRDRLGTPPLGGRL